MNRALTHTLLLKYPFLKDKDRKQQEKESKDWQSKDFQAYFLPKVCTLLGCTEMWKGDEGAERETERAALAMLFAFEHCRF